VKHDAREPPLPISDVLEAEPEGGAPAAPPTIVHIGVVNMVVSTLMIPEGSSNLGGRHACDHGPAPTCTTVETGIVLWLAELTWQWHGQRGGPMSNLWRICLRTLISPLPPK